MHEKNGRKSRQLFVSIQPIYVKFGKNEIQATKDVSVGL